MILPAEVLARIKNLRIQLQEDAGLGYPSNIMTELLVIYDVCKCLDFNVFQVRDILGAVGFDAVSGYINQGAIESVNREKASELLTA